VSRQIYKDFPVPRTTPSLVVVRGRIFVTAAYGLLFWVSWKDLRRIRLLAHRDRDIEVWASALRVVFVLFFFYSLFADLWLNPLMYVVVGLIICTKQYVEGAPEVAPTIAPVRMRRLGRAA
jgi:hypothetical protein